MNQYSRILVTGAAGFLGSHIVPVLELQRPETEIIPVERSEYDLLCAPEIDRMLRDIQPDVVINLAARVGGITANIRYPADFFFENIQLVTRVFHACQQAGVKKLVTFLAGCAYPAGAESPLNEDDIWDGYPQFESAPYSIARKTVLTQSEAYRRQYGFNSIVLIPGNLYGEHDDFSAESSHVIPALIRRFVEAKEAGTPEVVCYGTGRPVRDFVHAGDVATLVPWFLDNYDTSEPVNISTGRGTSIRDLAEKIRRIVGYDGEMVWDASKPDGQMERTFDISRLHDLGLRCDTALEAGLRRTVAWFLEARPVCGADSGEVQAPPERRRDR